MSDVHDLQRFVEAQSGGVYEQALNELRAGEKRSHWMWFVFPQIAGLGHSSTARYYAVAGMDEAAAYFEHPVLGPRLRECALVLTSLETRDAVRILGDIDAMKLHSSMTLFARVAPDESCFREVLEQYFDGEPDPRTLERL